MEGITLNYVPNIVDGTHIKLWVTPNLQICLIPQLERTESHTKEYFNQKVVGYKALEDCDCKDYQYIENGHIKKKT